MAYKNQNNPDCANCNKVGLAILPARYAVVPKSLDIELPTGLECDVTSTKLQNNKYILRTLRQGFLYIYYEKHSRGIQNKWEIYSVSARGTLWKQLSTGMIEPVIEERCSRKEHQLPASIIAITSPEKCGKIWMGFSEQKWSVETFKTFEYDINLRQRRMQIFDPMKWIKNQKHLHAIKSDEKNLNDILEYRSDFALSTLAGIEVSGISRPDGSYTQKLLSRCTTRYPLYIRRDDKKNLVDLMTQTGKTGNASHYTPVIIAMWDSVGITHELNGYRNDAIGWIEKYGSERELEIEALNSIEAAKKALEKRNEVNALSGMEAGVFKWDTEFSRRRLEAYKKTYPDDEAGYARQEILCKRWEYDASARVPLSIARKRENYVRHSDAEWKQGMAELDKAANQAMTPDSVTGKSSINKRDDLIKIQSAEAAKESAKEWLRYESKLDQREINIFKKNYTSFMSTAKYISDERTKDIITWMKSSLLQDALLEYNPSNLEDGLAFEYAVGDMLFGISSSPEGASIIKEWIIEGEVSDKNLLWRAIAFNHKEGIDAVNSILASITNSKEKNFNESTLGSIRESTKHFAKIFDLVKKSLSLHNTLRKAEIRQAATGGIEKLFMTVGNLFFQPYIKKGVDLLSEKFVLGLLLARSGVEHGKIITLIAAEAKFGRAERAETLLALSVGTILVNRNSSKEFIELKSAWKNLVENSDVPKSHTNPNLAGGFNEAKELRIAMIATLAQMVYVTKLYLDKKEDPDSKKLAGELWAASLALSAGLADLGATAIKGLHSLKDSAISFQVLKMSGGILSAGAAWIFAQNDYAAADKNEAAGLMLISRLYRIKAAAGLLGGACSTLTAMSYTKPAFELIAKKLPDTFIGRASSIVPRAGISITSRLLAGRALLMVGGMWFSVATIAIQVLIWKFSDNELEVWCSRCAFGIDKINRIRNSRTQMMDFEKSLLEVM